MMKHERKRNFFEKAEIGHACPTGYAGWKFVYPVMQAMPSFGATRLSKKLTGQLVMDLTVLTVS